MSLNTQSSSHDDLLQVASQEHPVSRGVHLNHSRVVPLGTVATAAAKQGHGNVDYKVFRDSKRVEDQSGAEAMIEAVKAVLDFRLVDCPSAKEMAQEFYISVRTFNRRLMAVGVTYRTIVEEVRRDKALELLKRVDLRLIDIAKELGYKDPSNFSKAFKNWMGVSPTDYRLQLSGRVISALG